MPPPHDIMPALTAASARAMATRKGAAAVPQCGKASVVIADLRIQTLQYFNEEIIILFRLPIS
jgi:hypothetical protein